MVDLLDVWADFNYFLIEDSKLLFLTFCLTMPPDSHYSSFSLIFIILGRVKKAFFVEFRMKDLAGTKSTLDWLLNGLFFELTNSPLSLDLNELYQI